MSYDFLTLGLAERQPGSGEFNVLAMKMSDEQIVCLELKKEQIIKNTGEYVWDIGKKTRVEGYNKKPDSRNNVIYYPSGKMTLLPEEIDLKELLEDKKTDFLGFINDTNETTAIVRINRVNSFGRPQKSYEDKPHHRAKVVPQGTQDEESVLIKDFRWVTYWDYIFNTKDDIVQRMGYINRYKNVLNNPSKKLYFIMYRRYFSKGPSAWVAGIHLL